MAKIYLARVLRPGNQKYHGPDENNGKVPTNVASIYPSTLFVVELVAFLISGFGLVYYLCLYQSFCARKMLKRCRTTMRRVIVPRR